MALVMHCDSCETWGRGRLARDFIKVDWAGRALHFCSWDCVMRHAAGQAPMHVIESPRLA